MQQLSLEALVVSVEEGQTSEVSMSKSASVTTSSDPHRIQTPTPSRTPPEGRRVFSFSSALDVSGVSIDSIPDLNRDLPLTAEDSWKGMQLGRERGVEINRGDDVNNPHAIVNDGSGGRTFLEAAPGNTTADVMIDENCTSETIKQLDLQSSYRSDSNSNSDEWSSRTLAVFRVDVKLDDSAEAQRTKNGIARLNDAAIHRHKNDKWVMLTRQAQEHRVRKIHFPILFRWPSKVFGLLQLTFLLALLITCDERRLVELRLAADQYINTTSMCIDDNVRLLTHVDSKGEGWVVLIARASVCGISKIENNLHNETARSIVAVCLCIQPSIALLEKTKFANALHPVTDVLPQCAMDKAMVDCINKWKNPSPKALLWEAGPNGKFTHGDRIMLNQNEAVGVIWSGENPAEQELKELNAVIIIVCVAIILLVLWFGLKVIQHYRKEYSLSSLYGIS